ncbi:hypothetical protein SELMODRAFT_416213 [Selaginella moellendorffii]|uniref:Uncharacterized protein n=1 Tax=Selaginella moellendorffii TaxID=88036 RepID=D8RYF8_SELML|nr:hypothetical protein SELMODRAFT_416213 [Selaginella moellendorffii]
MKSLDAQARHLSLANPASRRARVEAKSNHLDEIEVVNAADRHHVMIDITPWQIHEIAEIKRPHGSLEVRRKNFHHTSLKSAKLMNGSNGNLSRVGILALPAPTDSQIEVVLLTPLASLPPPRCREIKRFRVPPFSCHAQDRRVPKPVPGPWGWTSCSAFNKLHNGNSVVYDQLLKAKDGFLPTAQSQGWFLSERLSSTSSRSGYDQLDPLQRPVVMKILKGCHGCVGVPSAGETCCTGFVPPHEQQCKFRSINLYLR